MHETEVMIWKFIQSDLCDNIVIPLLFCFVLYFITFLVL